MCDHHHSSFRALDHARNWTLSCTIPGRVNGSEESSNEKEPESKAKAKSKPKRKAKAKNMASDVDHEAVGKNDNDDEGADDESADDGIPEDLRPGGSKLKRPAAAKSQSKKPAAKRPRKNSDGEIQPEEEECG